MFCDKCGNRLPENALFCDKCGNKVAAEAGETQHTAEDFFTTTPAAQTANRRPRGAVFYGSAAVSVLMIVMLLQKWIQVPALSYFTGKGGSAFSLFQVYDMIDLVSKYVDSGNLTLIKIGAAAAVIMAVAAIVLLCIHLVSMFFGKQNTHWAAASSDLSFALGAFAIVVVLLANAALEDAAGGWISGVLSVTASVYITMILAAVNFFLVKYLQKQNKQTSPGTESSFGA